MMEKLLTETIPCILVVMISIIIFTGLLVVEGFLLPLLLQGAH